MGISVCDVALDSGVLLKIDAPPATATWLHGSMHKRIVHNGKAYITMVARVMGALVAWELVEPIAKSEVHHA